MYCCCNLDQSGGPSSTNKVVKSSLTQRSNMYRIHLTMVVLILYKHCFHCTRQYYSSSWSLTVAPAVSSRPFFFVNVYWFSFLIFWRTTEHNVQNSFVLHDDIKNCKSELVTWDGTARRIWDRVQRRFLQECVADRSHQADRESNGSCSKIK